jgi:hypothetical protein
MDATTRWETEAIRSGSSRRANPPRPSSKQGSTSRRDRTWLTLKEAEAATGIPSNTLRKWVRKDAIDTYLESDGEMAIRMVDLGSVRARAEELGRDDLKSEVRSQKSEVRSQKSEVRSQNSEPGAGSGSEDHRSQITDHSAEAASPPGTMLVPVDAWNKMLSQLGNLHEAGQQLAEARERAAKAETEAIFLRERLKEFRSQMSDVRSLNHGDTKYRMPDAGSSGAITDHPEEITDHRSQITNGGERTAEGAPQPHAPEPLPGAPETTTYWRYLTTGWRDRKRRSNS